MAALIAAGAAIVGDVIAQQGQSQTNQSNQAFSQAQTLQAEQWEEHMSDTAMQRRVADLKQAGMNPMLAISQGGASQPSINPMGIPAQNPDTAFGNLGAQVSSAMQVDASIQQQQAQAEQARAQARLAQSQTPSGTTTDAQGNTTVTVGANHDLGDAQLAKIQADTGVSIEQAKQVKANVDYIHAQENQTNIQALLNGQNLQILQATKQALIQQETAQGAQAANLEAVQGGKLGRVLGYINAILQPVHSAAGAAGNVIH